MKIQAINNYQSNKTNQQSFGVAIFDRRGLERVPEGARTIISDAFGYAQDALGELAKSEKFDALAYVVQVAGNLAKIVIARPTIDGRIAETSLSIDNPLLDFALARKFEEALKTPHFTYGTFADCSQKNPDLPKSFGDTTLPLTEKEIEKRFPTLA